MKQSPMSVSWSIYFTVYFLLIIAELVVVITLWSPYGEPDGKLKGLYGWVRDRLNSFMLMSVFVLAILSFFFPGVGMFALLVLIYRVAEKCCYYKENFGDGLLFGFGDYSPDNDTVYDQGYLDRTTNSAFSSAHCDNKDPYFLFPLDQENWIIPKIVKQCNIPKNNLSFEGAVLQESIRPRGLYTTSLLAKQLHER